MSFASQDAYLDTALLVGEASELLESWQILGPARVPLKEMVALDYLYVANWSLSSDVKILLRTVSHVFGRRGL